MAKKNIPVEDRQFGVHWMDSCHQETLLPDSPWHKVEDILNAALAKKITKQLEHPDRRQMIFELLGPEFTKKYFPDHEQHLALLEPPAMSGSTREKLQQEAQSWLQTQMTRTAAEEGCPRLRLGEPVEEPRPEMVDFLKHTYQVFAKGLDRHLYLQETELIKQTKLDLAMAMKNKTNKENKPPPSRAPSLFLKPSTASSSTSSDVSIASEKPSTGHIKAKLHDLTDEPPTFWGPQSDTMGSAIIAILKKDPRRFEEVAIRLRGRQLPGSLRQYMWTDILFKLERQRLKDVNVEKLVRERFGRAVARGVGELRIKRATHSPISGLIENAVIEIYESTPSMLPFNYDTHLKEAARVLNVLFVYDRSYEPYLVHWLFPLQLAFRNGSHQGEYLYELAMYLYLFARNCFPKWPEVFSIAETVMTELKSRDPELYNHLKEISQKNVKVNPKEFLVQLIHQEKEKAAAIRESTPMSGGSQGSRVGAKGLLSDPLIFIRKWVGEGFVSILDTQAVILIWDQCFMQNWDSSVMIDVCLALMLLLRHKFMTATDYHSMKKVFLKEPSKLYTMDIQRGWIHLQNRLSSEDVPYMNRQRPGTAPRRKPTPLSRPETKSPTPSSVSLCPLPPAGIKDIRLKLIVPAGVLVKEPWLSSINLTDIQLYITIYFGSSVITSKHSNHQAIERSAAVDKSGNKVYRLEFPKDVFVFDELDASQYDVEREMGGYPFAVVRVDYSKAGTSQTSHTPIVLGWAKIPLFRNQPSASHPLLPGQQWELLDGMYSYTLYAGSVPETVTEEGQFTPVPSSKVYLAPDSELSALVFDPVNHPPSVRGTPSSGPKITKPKTPKKAPSVRHSVPPTPNYDPWVPYNAEAAKSNPEPTGPSEPFDLYVDGVNFIPDNATLVKVTGRVLRTGSVKVTDILAIPELGSPSRCPKFNYVKYLNEEGIEMDPTAIAILRVYTVSLYTEDLVVIGSCLLPLFTNEGSLNVGGHQLRLHSGMPDLRGGIAALKSTDLDKIYPVPGASLLVRILPHQKDSIPAPDYSSGYYQSASCEPNTSENRIMRSFMKDKSFTSRQVRNVIWLMHERQGEDWKGKTDDELLLWLQDRLDSRKHLEPQQPAGNLNLLHCVKYRIHIGLNVKVVQAYGIPEGSYVQCFTRVIAGIDTSNKTVTEDGFGKGYKFTTLKHDYKSLQKAPKWIDEPQTVHPFFDPHTHLLIQIFVLDAVYQPTADHSTPGKVIARRGGDLEITAENMLAWTVVPLFNNKSVMTGEHHVPLFKGKPDDELLKEINAESILQVLNRKQWNNSNRFPGSSLVVSVWDAHYEEREAPPVPEYMDMPVTVCDASAWEKVRKDKKGKTLEQMIVDSLDRKYKKLGTNSPVYLKEREFFEKAMTETFVELMESALLNAGYGPL